MGSGTDLDLNLRGENSEMLERASEELVEYLREFSGLVQRPKLGIIWSARNAPRRKTGRTSCGVDPQRFGQASALRHSTASKFSASNEEVRTSELW